VRRRLRRFVAASVAVTVLDVVALVVLVQVRGWAVPAADAAAIAVASLASWVVHRAVTVPGDPFRKWAQRPAAFAATAVVTGAFDVLVTTLIAGVRPGGTGLLVVAKVVALLFAGTLRALAYRVLNLEETRARLARRVVRPPSSGDVRLTVVVPAYREVSRIAGTVETVRTELDDVARQGGLEVLVVDDGSGDGTAEAAEAAGAEVIRQPDNRGKGAAVRAGMLAARGRTVAFLDADLAYPPGQLRSFLAAVEDGWDVVVGSRRHPGSETGEATSGLRSLSGQLFNLFTVVVLLGQYRDTQCGCKAFRSDAARLLFGRARLDRFAFDVEVFHLVERYQLSLTEVPVQLVVAEGSTVRVGVDAASMVADLFRVRLWGGQGLYDATPEELLPAQGGGAGRS
jgi:dolichyl-phosphate beta-glucosyltransferase